MSVPVVLKMLERRGYTVDNVDESPEDESYGFIIDFQDGKKKGQVYYFTKDKINVDDLSDILVPILNKLFHIIIVYKKITIPALNKFNENISKYLKRAELIDEKYLIQDILSHPKVASDFRRVSKTEKEEIFKLYSSQAESFPKMKPNDPAVIIMGFQVGDLIEISCWYNFTKKQIDRAMPAMITYATVVE